MRLYADIHPEDRLLQGRTNAGTSGVLEMDMVHGNIRAEGAAHTIGIGGKLRSYFEGLTHDFAHDGQVGS